MSNFNIQISTINNQLEIESTVTNQILQITNSANDTVQISTEYFGSVVFASDVVGLDQYLSAFIDQYQIDCGTP